MRQPPHPMMRCIGLAALLAVFPGHRALHAQSLIGPGTFTQTQIVDGQDAVVVGPTTIDVPDTPGAGWGLVARNGANVVLNSTGGAIQLVGATPLDPVLLVQTNAVVTSAGSQLSLSSSGNGQAAVSVRDASNVTLSDAVITTAGGMAGGNVGAYGVGVIGAAGSGTLTGGSIATSGGSGAVFATGGLLSLHNVAIEVRLAPGNRGHGINAQAGGRIDVDG